MNIEEMVEAFQAVTDECLKFDKIEDKLHDNAQICGLLYLHKLVSANNKLKLFSYMGSEGIAALNINMADLAKVIKVKDIIYLTRCGIFCNTTWSQHACDPYLYISC